MPVTTYVTAGLVFVAVTLGFLSILFLTEWMQNRRRATKALQQLRTFADDLGDTARPLLRQGAGSEWLESMAERTPQLRDMERLLQRAGLTWSLRSFLLLICGLAVGLGLAALVVFQFWPAGIGGATLGAAVPIMVVKRRATKRMRRFEEQLPEGIDLISRAIRAGHPLSAGMKMIAEEAQEPVAGEFQRVFEEQRFGLAFDDTLFSLADRVPLVDVRILITAMLIQREVGGNLAEILDKLAYTIRERFKLKRQLRVITAQGRMSGYVLAALPMALAAVLSFLNPEYMSELINEPVGRIMIGIAATLQILGYLWIRRIVNVEF